VSTPDVSDYGHRYGRLPNDPTKPRLRLTLNPAAVLPNHPGEVDYASDIKLSLQMLDNDRYGNCVSVTWANDRYLITNDLTDVPNYPSLEEVLALYKTQNPNFPADDNGMVIQDVLSYLRKTGGPDGIHAVAFGQVSFADVEQLKAAIAIFGAVWLGISVTDLNERQFSDNKGWTYQRDAKNLGGHGVPAVGYDGTTIKFLTWAEETSFDLGFLKTQVDEAWVVIWPELLGSRALLEGVDLLQLAADYQVLTGDPLPIPTPGPVPPPTPDPGAATFLGASEEVSARIRRAAARHRVDVISYQEKHWRKHFDMPPEQLSSPTDLQPVR
jgi:hypothetical protein